MAANVIGMFAIPYYNHLLSLLETSPELSRTGKGILKQMAYAAGGAGVGGIVGGPLGALVGTAVGGLIGYMKSDPYDSMLDVLRKLSEKEKRELVEKVQSLVGSTAIEELTRFIAQQVNRELLVNLVSEFAQKAASGG